MDLAEEKIDRAAAGQIVKNGEYSPFFCCKQASLKKETRFIILKKKNWISSGGIGKSRNYFNFRALPILYIL